MIKPDDWCGKDYSFFQHRTCEAFPCHSIDERKDFNCLFCYCPLYALGNQCGGNFSILPNGVKDCTYCTLPHHKSNYGLVVEKLQELVKRVAEKA